MSDAMWDSDPVWLERKERERETRRNELGADIRKSRLADYFEQPRCDTTSEEILELEPAADK